MRNKLIFIITATIVLIIVSSLYYRFSVIKVVQNEKSNILYEFENYCIQNSVPESKDEFVDFINYTKEINLIKYKTFDYDFVYSNEGNKVVVSIDNFLNFGEEDFNVLNVKIDTKKICDKDRILNVIKFNRNNFDSDYVDFNNKLKLFLNNNYDTISAEKFEELDFINQKKFSLMLFRFKKDNVKCVCDGNQNNENIIDIENKLNVFFEENHSLKTNKNSKNFGFIILNKD